MKRAAFTVAFGLFGLVYVYGMPFVRGLIWPEQGLQQHGEDEANRQLEIYILLGGALFFVLWAWIGSVLARNWRKAGLMAGGVIVGTVIMLFSGRVLTSALGVPDDWRIVGLSLALWAALCAGLAYLLGRRSSPRSAPGFTERSTS
jgi:hypothetical protein